MTDSEHARAGTGSDRFLDGLGWRRRSDCDEGQRQAWELPDGVLLLLDPSGASDAVFRPPAPREKYDAKVASAQSEAERLCRVLTDGWSNARQLWASG
jgi:hypothetical protein